GDPLRRTGPASLESPLHGGRQLFEVEALVEHQSDARHLREDGVPFPPLAQLQLQGTARSWSAETPSATLTATEPSSETGWSAIVRPEPPTRTLAPTPRPSPTSPEAPTYSPASAPAGTPVVGANTAQPNTPPPETPILSPIILSAP